jgi:hypothetical protein
MLNLLDILAALSLQATNQSQGLHRSAKNCWGDSLPPNGFLAKSPWKALSHVSVQPAGVDHLTQAPLSTNHAVLWATLNIFPGSLQESDRDTPWLDCWIPTVIRR